MGFKQLSYWLKGGIIGVCFYILVSLILSPFDHFGIIIALLSPGIWIYELFVSILGHGIKIDANLKSFIFILLSIIGWFIIGSLIGLIMGKIKRK